MKKPFFPLGIFGAALSLALLSCDLLRAAPFEVSAWSPGAGFHDSGGDLSLSLSFSQNPDRASVERHFSLTEDGNRVKGAFLWEGRRMVFLPRAPLEKNRDYALGLDAGAMNEKGLSLDRQFEGFFTTRPEDSRPRLVSAFPENGACLYEKRGELELVFSRPVSLKSLWEHFSISPAMNGLWSRGAGEGSVCFTPAEPWRQGQRYEIRVSASLAGETGKTLGKEWVSVFTAGDDRVKPFLKSAWRMEKGGVLEALEEDIPPPSGVFAEIRENPGWGKDSRIRLVFSEPVDTALLKSRFTAEPAPSLVLENEPGFNEEVIFRFTGPPAWGSRFSFQLQAGVRDAAGNESEGNHRFWIHADSVYSKPPELAGLRLPLSPGKAGAEDQALAFYTPEDLFAELPINSGEGQYPYGEAVRVWIELYFDTAPGASVDAFTVMELFRIETSNNVLGFSPRSIRAENFSVPEAQAGRESCVRLEIQGDLTNTINAGLVNFRIDPGLRDSLGNQSENAFWISLLK
jgi:hypothetical protein